MTYFDLFSMLKMNLETMCRLNNQVLVYHCKDGLGLFKLNDVVHVGVKLAWYKLDGKVVKVKVSTVDAPEPYTFFVFGEQIGIR